MQDEGPYADEAPPTEEELREARLLAEALDHRGEPPRGSLAELAQAARATVRDDGHALAGSTERLAREGVERGLARRTSTTRRVAFAALAAAAVAVAGFVAFGPSADRGSGPIVATESEVSLPPLSAWPGGRHDDGEPSSARVDRMARLASEDWLAAELAEAQARDTESP
ncbi:MAG: hypothetical protein K1X94_03135 [Sandaracinaceae bacterium]|nr:hypothetical protein [Sandaracinaceae bacterium]